MNRFVGYYQDLKYLEESKDKFRNVLGIKSDKTLQETVLVHIRRTDYLKISQELDLKFYTNALKAFNPDIKIDIFTDEINFQYDKFFIKKNVRNIFLNNNKTSPSETLRKMSMYKNFIIANSSYSLIAAYLSLSKEKKLFILSHGLKIATFISTIFLNYGFLKKIFNFFWFVFYKS